MIIQFFQFLKYHMFCEMKKKFLWFIWFASSSEDANIEPQVTLQEAAVRPQSRTSPQGTHLNPTEVNFAKALTSNSVKPRVNTKRGKKLHKDNPVRLIWQLSTVKVRLLLDLHPCSRRLPLSTRLHHRILRSPYQRKLCKVAKKLKLVNDRKPKLTFNEEDDTSCDLEQQFHIADDILGLASNNDPMEELDYEPEDPLMEELDSAIMDFTPKVKKSKSVKFLKCSH